MAGGSRAHDPDGRGLTARCLVVSFAYSASGFDGIARVTAALADTIATAFAGALAALALAATTPRADAASGDGCRHSRMAVADALAAGQATALAMKRQIWRAVRPTAAASSLATEGQASKQTACWGYTRFNGSRARTRTTPLPEQQRTTLTTALGENEMHVPAADWQQISALSIRLADAPITAQWRAKSAKWRIALPYAVS